MLRALFAIAAALLLTIDPAAATAPAAVAKTKARQPAADKFPSPEAIQLWMKGYRAKPEPHLLPAAVKAMSRLGVFREVDGAGIYFGFTAGVIGSNPKLADKLIGEMFPMQPEDQIVVVRAIAWSGLPDWKQLMARFTERMPARRVLIERHLYGKLPGLMGVAVDENPAGIDALWGYYYGSGAPEPIQRLISLLEWSNNDNDVDKLTAGSMIKYTMAVNATRDPELLVLLRREAVHQGKGTARPFAEVIEAAETYETARVRKRALDTIAEVKQKGSSTKRNVSFWGQIGSTALALGCVAASAMGQVQIGLPCIVGGATASAALRVFTLEK